MEPMTDETAATIGELLDSTMFENDMDVQPPDVSGFDLKLWRGLVMPLTPKKHSKGGIAIPEAASRAQQYLTACGRLLAVGALWGQSPRFTMNGVTQKAPEVGDWVVFGKYAGQDVVYKGVALKIFNDDMIIAVVKDPKDIGSYIA
jgi:co-chaperonin GroES (HSP10)